MITISGLRDYLDVRVLEEDYPVGTEVTLHHSSIPIPRPLWSDPSFVLGYELDPMRSKDGCNMVANMRGRAKHNYYLV